MSKKPTQIHVFFGAPIIPSQTAVSQEQTYSAMSANPWKITQFFYHPHSLNVSAETCKCDHLEDHRLPVPLKEHILMNSGKTRSWQDEDYLTCVPETQCIESQNSDPSRIIDTAYYREQMPGFESRVQQHLNEGKYHYPVDDDNKIMDQQEKFESNFSLQNLFKKNSQPIKQDYSHIWDLVCSTKLINTEPEAVENDHVPSKNHETVNHSLGFSSLQITDEPKDKGVIIKKISSFSTSADIEFLTIMTSSKKAFLAQSLDKEQSFLSKETSSMKPESKESCKEVRLGNSNNFVNASNQANSLELFSPNRPETTSNITPLNCSSGIKENTASQELFKTPNEQPTNDFCIDSFSTRKNCCQQNTFHKVSMKRNRTSEDKSGPSSTVSEALHGSKKVKSVCSSETHQIFSKATPEKNVSSFGKFLNKTSLLKNCVCKSQRYNCLVMALHPCHVKEIHIKTGPNSGCKVPLATITVIDQSEIKKVVLWRDAAFHMLTVFPGDIILLTDVTIHDDQWYRETVLQSTSTTQLLNLGSCSSVQAKEYSYIVSVTVLQDLLGYISSKHSYIVDLPFRHPQKLENIQYVELDQLQPNTLVHSILKVVNITILTEAVYGYRGQKQRKIILTVEQVQDQHFILVLWGPGAAWYSEFQRKRDHLWEFKYLLTQHNSTSGHLELHTTPWSSCECLFEDDMRAIDFRAKFQKRESHLVKISHLSALLEEKHSGVVQIEAQILALMFPFATHESQQLVLDASTSLKDILTCFSAIIYSGCGKCGLELEIDENKIYKQCVSCLPFTMVKLYYRSALMTVSDGKNEIQIHAGSEMMQKILLNIPPDWLSRVIVPSSGITYGMVAADLCHSLLASREKVYTLKIQSLFILDENSYPLQQDFYLLDFHSNFEV